MTKKEVDKTSFNYRRLKTLYPHLDRFFEYYYDGDYYNKAYTVYYDFDGNELETETHGYYG